MYVEKMGESNYLNVESLVKYLGKSKSWAYKMCADRKLPFYKVGRHNLFKVEEINNWIEKGRIRPISEIEGEVEQDLNNAA